MKEIWLNSINKHNLNLLHWLLIPLTATASLNPAPVTVSKVPLLGENTPYVVDYPISSGNALESSYIASGVGISTSTLLGMYMPKEMLPVLECESHLEQWTPDGHILTSSTSDIGIAQINLKTWAAKAKELGYDIYQTEGNLEMAKWILDNTSRGMKNWTCYNLIVNK